MQREAGTPISRVQIEYASSSSTYTVTHNLSAGSRYSRVSSCHA